MRDARAVLTALPVAFLVYLVLVPETDVRLFAPSVFRVLLGLDLAVRVVLAGWGLRAYLATGAAAPLVLAVGLLGYVSMYVWRFVLAIAEQPVLYSTYGSLARSVFAVALLNVVGVESISEPERRRGLVAAGVGIAAGLCLLGSGLSLPIRWLAGGQPDETRRLVHGVFEGAAVLLTLAAGERVLRLSGQLDRRVTHALLAGLALTAEESLFLITGEPWRVRWWLGRLVGLAAAFVLGWAVLRAAAVAASQAGPPPMPRR